MKKIFPKDPDAPAIDMLLKAGYTPEAATYFLAFDKACAGREATVVIPVTLGAIENLVGMLAPDAQRVVANLLSEAAFRISQAAALAAEPTEGEPSEVMHIQH